MISIPRGSSLLLLVMLVALPSCRESPTALDLLDDPPTLSQHAPSASCQANVTVVVCEPGLNGLSTCIQQQVMTLNPVRAVVRLAPGTYVEQQRVDLQPGQCIRIEPLHPDSARPIVRFDDDHWGGAINLGDSTHISGIRFHGPYTNAVGVCSQPAVGAPANCTGPHPGWDNGSKYGINGAGKSNWILDGIEVNGFRDNGIHGGYSHNVSIRNSAVRYNGRTGIAPYVHVSHWDISGDTIEHNAQDGIDASGSNHVIADNRVHGNGWGLAGGDMNGILLIGATAVQVTGNVATGNHGEDLRFDGVWLGSNVGHLIAGNTLNSIAIVGALVDVQLRDNVFGGTLDLYGPALANVSACGTQGTMPHGIPGLNVIRGACGTVNSPLAVAGLASWVDASQISGPIGSTLGGSLPDLVMTPTYYYPVSGAAQLQSGFGGFRSLFFNGSSSYGAPDHLFLNTPEYTIVAAVQGWGHSLLGSIAPHLGCTSGLQIDPHAGNLRVENVGSSPSQNAHTVSFSTATPGGVFAVTQSASARTIYRNGSSAGVTSVSPVPVSNCSVQFGRDYDGFGGWTYAGGHLGEVLVFNRELTPNEVWDVSDYLRRKWTDGGGPPPLQSPTQIAGLGSWIDASQLTAPAGTPISGSLPDLIDPSGRYYPVSGAAIVSTAFAPGKSLYFNGQTSYGAPDWLYTNDRSYTMLAVIQGWSNSFLGSIAPHHGCAAGLQVDPHSGALRVENVGSQPTGNAHSISFGTSPPGAMFAIVQTASTRTLHRNGVMMGSVAVTPVPPTACSVQFARDYDGMGGWVYASGHLGELLIYDRPLSQAELAQVSGYLMNKWF